MKKVLAIAIALTSSITGISQEKDGFLDTRDGNTYATVKIGDQLWMAKNLGYIPKVYPPSNEGGIYVYNYYGFNIDSAKQTEEYNTFGCLYNWKLANTVCPNGWHLPSDIEWKHLEEYLGMSPSEADSLNWRKTGRVDLKLVSKNVWDYDNYDNINESGFSLLPGGLCFSQPYLRDTTFALINESANLWTSTKTDSVKAWSRGFYNKATGIGRAQLNTSQGHSVRCIKDK